MVRSTLSLIVLFAIGNVSLAFAGETLYAQNHAGQMDTDGILSPGEVRNPGIDYDKAQRHGERRGDERYDNQINDSAAENDREIKDDRRGQYDGDRDRREHREDRRDDRRQESRSWWHW